MEFQTHNRHLASSDHETQLTIATESTISINELLQKILWCHDQRTRQFVKSDVLKTVTNSKWVRTAYITWMLVFSVKTWAEASSRFTLQQHATKTPSIHHPALLSFYSNQLTSCTTWSDGHQTKHKQTEITITTLPHATLNDQWSHQAWSYTSDYHTDSIDAVSQIMISKYDVIQNTFSRTVL